MKQIKAMTLGFIFDSSLREVLLIKKNRPEWQKGFHNGVGGHADTLEARLEKWEECFVREAKEETNLLLDADRLVKIGRIRGENEKNPFIVVMFAYRLKSTQERNVIDTITDEELVWVPIEDIDMIPLIENLRFIIPFARYKLSNSAVMPSSSIDLVYGE